MLLLLEKRERGEGRKETEKAIKFKIYDGYTSLGEKLILSIWVMWKLILWDIIIQVSVQRFSAVVVSLHLNTNHSHLQHVYVSYSKIY